eukprot:5130298-Amphidinium_carterae.1
MWPVQLGSCEYVSWCHWWGLWVQALAHRSGRQEEWLWSRSTSVTQVQGVVRGWCVAEMLGLGNRSRCQSVNSYEGEEGYWSPNPPNGAKNSRGAIFAAGQPRGKN